MKFLRSMNPGWNISLFHYRNHGADYGRVLVGLQVPKAEMREFRGFLGKLGYPYADETRNPGVPAVPRLTHGARSLRICQPSSRPTSMPWARARPQCSAGCARADGKDPDGHDADRPDQGAFMQVLVRAIGAKRCLEIGTFTGYSSLAVALAVAARRQDRLLDVSEGMDLDGAPPLEAGRCSKGKSRSALRRPSKR